MMQNPNPQMASRSANTEAGIAAALSNERDPNKKINLAMQILQSMGEKGVNIVRSSLSSDELQMLSEKIKNASEQGVGSINTPQMAAYGGRMGFADGGSSEIKSILRRNPALAEHYRYKVEMGFEGSFMDLMEQMAEEAYDDRPNYYDYNNGGRVGYQDGMRIASGDPDDDDDYKSPPFIDDPGGTFDTDIDEVMKLIETAMPGANPSDIVEAYDRAVQQGFQGTLEEFIRMMGGDRRDMGMSPKREGIMSMMRA